MTCTGAAPPSALSHATLRSGRRPLTAGRCRGVRRATAPWSPSSSMCNCSRCRPTRWRDWASAGSTTRWSRWSWRAAPAAEASAPVLAVAPLAAIGDRAVARPAARRRPRHLRCLPAAARSAVRRLRRAGDAPAWLDTAERRAWCSGAAGGASRRAARATIACSRRLLDDPRRDGLLAARRRGVCRDPAVAGVEPEPTVARLRAQFPAASRRARAHRSAVARAGRGVARRTRAGGAAVPGRLARDGRAPLPRFADGAVLQRPGRRSGGCGGDGRRRAPCACSSSAPAPAARPRTCCRACRRASNTPITDVGPLFVAQGARALRGSRRSCASRCSTSSATRSRRASTAGSFDVVIAANVIHATSDLRRTLGQVRQLLAPGGLLVMLEVTAPQRWFDLTVGLTDGWWAFTDTRSAPRLRHAVARRRGCELLGECGFARPKRCREATARPARSACNRCCWPARRRSTRPG